MVRSPEEMSISFPSMVILSTAKDAPEIAPENVPVTAPRVATPDRFLL